MSERLQKLTMSAFRGVPGDLELDLADGRSVVVFGENGTGKSTIADALEWYLTGEIELLSHEGRGHAVRHVGSPDEHPTAVEVVADGQLTGRAVFPDQPNEAVHEIAARETFLLRGRTLADFINKTKTEKWKSLAEILGLDAVDRLRRDLQKVRTELRRKARTAAARLEECRKILAREGELDEQSLYAGLEQICKGLELEPPGSLDGLADPAWVAGLLSHQGSGGDKPKHSDVLDELQALDSVDLEPRTWKAWNELVSGEQLPHLRAVQQAVAYLERSPDANACPVCGQEVTATDLGEGLRMLLSDLESTARELEQRRSEAEDLLETAAEGLKSREGLRLKVAMLGLELPPVPASPVADVRARLEAEEECDLQSLSGLSAELASWDEAARELAAGAAKGDSKASASQLDMLLELCRQIQAWREAEEEAATTARARDLIDRLYAGYEKRQQEYLTQVLERINSRVAEIYDSLHPGEGLDKVTVEPWTAKGVELAIDFHGSRQRPPHGVLSESHLNSLAIALFLAMAETFNQSFRFLVLDDVINSFDLEHRSTLADLLARKEDWQLIVLTHDHSFYEHLKRRAPRWRKLELTSWSFEEGPRTSLYRTRGLLGEARVSLENDDVVAAAAKARRGLEELLQEACEALRALLPFRRGISNDRRELGELFQGLRRALKAHAKTFLQELEPLLRNLEADVAATLNVEVHASRGRAAAAEIEGALGRADELDRTLGCDECETRIWFKGTPEAGRCRCGRKSFPPPPATA